MIRPPIKAGVIEVVRGIHVHMPPMVVIAVIEVAVRVTVVGVAAPPEIVAMVIVRALHIARTATLSIDVAVVGAFYMDCPVAVQPVMHVHAPLGVMHVADLAIGPLA
jgi:hypothetical protein